MSKVIVHCFKPQEAALLVGLYDRMGSATILAAYMYGGLFAELENVCERLRELMLVEATAIEKGSKYAPGVDVALTDNGMLVAHELQQYYDRRKMPALFGEAHAFNEARQLGGPVGDSGRQQPALPHTDSGTRPALPGSSS